MKTKRNGFAYGILLVSCAVALFPFLWSAFAATHTNTQIYQIQWALRPGTRLLSNLKDLTASFPLGRNMFSSLFIALVYTLGILLIDSMAGFAFAKYEFKGKGFLFALCLMAMFIPTQVTLIPLFIEMTAFHMIDTYWSVILPGFASIFGVFLMRQNFMAFPGELMESARIDGAGKGRIFISIMMPIAVPGLAFVLIQTFLSAWNELQMAMIFINDTSLQPISVVPLRFTQTAGVQGFPLEVMYAALVICLSPIAVFYVFGSRFLIAGLTQGAIKG